MSKRVRWKPLAVLAATLVVVVGVSYLFISKARERKEFVSQVDPQGYRCRFTLSADWQKGSISAGGPGTALRYVDAFNPAPPNPIMAWIAEHFSGQTAPPVNSPNIILMSPNMQVTRSIFQIQAGYPELINKNQVLTHRHLRIDGFPATVTTEADKSQSGTMLIVYVPDHSVAYALLGSTDIPDTASVNREMQAIISSFHVEKVAAPTGGKK